MDAERLLIEQWRINPQQVLPVGPVYQVTTDDGEEYCLKRGKHGLPRLTFHYHAIEALWNNGYQGTPRFVPTAAGEPFAKTPDGAFCLTAWVGRPLDFAAQDEWVLAARELARFHRASEGMKLSADTHKVYFSGKWSRRLAERCDELHKHLHSLDSSRNEFEATVLLEAHTLRTQANRAVELLEASEYDSLVLRVDQQPTLVHGNVKAENFTLDRAGRVHVIDFDSFRLDVSVQDVTDLFAAALPALHYARPAAEDMLRAYHEVHPLSAAEIDVMIALLSFPFRAHKVLYKYCVEGRSVEKSLRKWTRARGELQPQQEFLEEWASWLRTCVQ